MTLNALSSTNLKRRRIMIITADEDIIDEIEKGNDASLLTQFMLQSETNKHQNRTQQNKIKVSEQRNKLNRRSLTCVICESSASGYNFGAIACESCKAFFRRNALKHPDIFQCRNKGDCQITSETRRECPACRLAKCFNSGMKRNLLSTQEQKAEKRRRIEENRDLTSHSNSKINEEQSLVSDDSLLPIDTNLLLLTDFSDLLSSQPDHLSLSPNDLQQIETISHLYQKRIELATRDGLPWDPSLPRITFSQILNSQSVSVMRLLSFFKQIPEFNQLNVEDKVTLIKYNLTMALRISSTLSYKRETGQFIETDSDAPLNTEIFQLIHGYHICAKSKKIFDAFLSIANYDKKIIHLSLIVLLLTKGCSTTDIHEPILNDTMAVYRAQNYYIELLWKYMEAFHGFQVAVQLFTKFIIHVMAWQTVEEDMRNDIVRILSPNDIDQLVPIIKSILHLY